MSVLPLCIEIERPSPMFAPRLSHRDLLSELVFPAIIATQRRRWQELQNRNGTSQEKVKTNESQVKPQNDVSAEERLSQETYNENEKTPIKSDADKFEVSLDVHHFSPQQLSVKTANGYIVVEGTHKEKQDGQGFVSRQFVRRYALPEGCHPDTVKSNLSSNGVLTVSARGKLQLNTTNKPTMSAVQPESSRDIPSTSKQQ